MWKTSFNVYVSFLLLGSLRYQFLTGTGEPKGELLSKINPKKIIEEQIMLFAFVLKILNAENFLQNNIQEIQNHRKINPEESFAMAFGKKKKKKHHSNMSTEESSAAVTPFGSASAKPRH